MAPLFSKVDLNKLWHDVRNEETLICAKFGKDLFNISKVISRKTVAHFLTHSVYLGLTGWTVLLLLEIVTQPNQPMGEPQPTLCLSREVRKNHDTLHIMYTTFRTCDVYMIDEDLTHLVGWLCKPRGHKSCSQGHESQRRGQPRPRTRPLRALAKADAKELAGLKAPQSQGHALEDSNSEDYGLR